MSIMPQTVYSTATSERNGVENKFTMLEHFDSVVLEFAPYGFINAF